MYKYEIAQMAGCSRKSLARWLNMPKHKQKLAAMGVKTTAHMLPPKAVEYIITEFCIINE